MFNFELSATDFILAIAIVILFALFLSQRRTHGAAMQNSSKKEEIPFRESNPKTSKEKKSSGKPSASGFQECVHDFGYLKNLPPNTPVPEECFGCPEVMRCLFPEDQVRSAPKTVNS